VGGSEQMIPKEHHDGLLALRDTLALKASEIDAWKVNHTS